MANLHNKGKGNNKPSLSDISRASEWSYSARDAVAAAEGDALYRSIDGASYYVSYDIFFDIFFHHYAAQKMQGFVTDNSNRWLR